MTSIAANPTAPDEPPARAPGESSIRETIESVLVAFILAFMFRAFIVEAFVIPTGSMATTLLGAHMRFTCPDCGWAFTVNYSGGETRDGDIVIPTYAQQNVNVQSRGATVRQTFDQVFSVHCPNCGYRIPRVDPNGDTDNDATAPPVSFGDRILVLKYTYLLKDPAPFDVVVFKSPETPIERPGDYSQNYIKRLIGRPNEAIMVVDGDVYVAPSDFKDVTDFKIRRKPRYVQESLWRVVYDHDHQPGATPKPRQITDPALRVIGAEPPFVVPWKQVSGDGWTTPEGDRRTFAFGKSGGGGRLEFDADANPTKFALTDWLSYDVTINPPPGEATMFRPAPFDTFTTGGYAPFFYGPNGERIDRPQVPLWNVSDVKLKLYYTRQSGNGPLRLTTTKQDLKFAAELTPGQAKLSITRPGASVESFTAPIAQTDRPMLVELVNADYRITLYVDGAPVLSHEYDPDVAALVKADGDNFRPVRQPKPTIGIEAEDQQCSIAHLSLWRDVYYQNHNYLGNWQQRATPRDFPRDVIRLGPDEYFVMGDNPLMSGDARAWSQRVELPREGLHVDAGRVPARFLLGKAFFVYWPAGYRPGPGMPALVPNFGKMRFIH
jgi:signal peptidase I